MNEHTRQAGAIRVTVEEAQARIAELLRRAEAGERVEIPRESRPVVELAATDVPTARGQLRGAMKGEIWIAPDFDKRGPEWLVAELTAAKAPTAQKLPRVGAFEGQFELNMPDDWDELGPEWDGYVT